MFECVSVFSFVDLCLFYSDLCLCLLSLLLCVAPGEQEFCDMKPTSSLITTTNNKTK